MHNVLKYLEDSALRFKDKIAVIEEERSCTYQELKDRSYALGSVLAHENIVHEPVIVFMDKGLEALYSFFGTVASGNYYSLLNPDFPTPRLTQIQSVLQARVILTDQGHYNQAKELFGQAKVFLVSDCISQPVDEETVHACMRKTLDIDPLYVNFTSGSTGIPKGVMISHGSVIDFIDTFVETFGFSCDERFGNQAPFDFDVSVKDIYSCLKTGATLVIIPRKLFSRPTDLVDYLCDHQVSTLVWAVSALSLVCTFHGLEYRVPTTVRNILFSGEVMPYKHLMAWKKALPDVRMVNLYGPTEITCNCTYHCIEKQRDYSDYIPIGKPFANKGVFLLDEKDQRIENPNEPGEICVKGHGLAIGYVRNPEQTQAHFTLNPCQGAYEERIYRTGDLAYYNEKDELVFQGRKDYQIKYMGHRIELEEIERQALLIDGIEQCCVGFDQAKHRLYGFYAGTLEKENFVHQLRASLPVHMIPTRIFRMDRLPMTKNGKTDRKQLMEIGKKGGL